MFPSHYATFVGFEPSIKIKESLLVCVPELSRFRSKNGPVLANFDVCAL